jgi:hypothetical protein
MRAESVLDALGNGGHPPACSFDTRSPSHDDGDRVQDFERAGAPS